MQIKINYKGFTITAYWTAGERQTYNHPGCEEELSDIDYTCSDRFYKENKEDILDDLWREVDRMKQDELSY